MSPTIAALLANRKRKRGEANDEEDQENGAGTTNNDRETAEVLQPEKVRHSVYLVHQMSWSTMVVVQSMPKCLIVGGRLFILQRRRVAKQQYPMEDLEVHRSPAELAKELPHPNRTAAVPVAALDKLLVVYHFLSDFSYVYVRARVTRLSSMLMTLVVGLGLAYPLQYHAPPIAVPAYGF